MEHEDVMRFAREAGFQTRFVGYETTEADTVLRVAERANGWLLAKLEESPFYPEGGGQISDRGLVETPSGRARVVDVYRVGDDQALALEPVEGEIGAGETVRAVVERDTRLATMRNHTATHLLHAALRKRLGDHVRQAGSYVGPDKLRFDFTHGERLSPEDLAEVERLVGGWVASNHPVRAIETTRDEAERLGAMALFGEKYGDRVRMVEIEGVSRELCGGTHVSATSEIGLFHVTTETSSASNVRRIEAVTGPEAARLFQERTQRLNEIAARLKVPEHEVVHAVERLSERVKELERKPKGGSDGGAQDQLVAGAEEIAGIPRGGAGRGRDGLGLAARPLRRGPAEARRRGRGAGLGRRRPGAPRGERGALGGRARREGGRRGARRGAGGRRRRRRARHDGAGRRPRSREAARRARNGQGRDREGARLMARILALDHGSARCGCAISDPSGTLATPLPVVERPDTKRGLATLARLVEEQGVERVVVGLPLTLSGDEGHQAGEARTFAERLERRVSVPVELHDERLTTRLAERTGGEGDADSRAAAHLLESYLARSRAGAPE